MEKNKRKNVRSFEQDYEIIPIGTKGYINLGGKIFEARIYDRAILPTATDFWVSIYNVWLLPNGEEILTPMRGKHTINYGGTWASISNTIEGAKRNEQGKFDYKVINTMDYLTEKYGLTENNLKCCHPVLYKMVNGFPQKYDAVFDLTFVGNDLIITIPDIENGIAFKTAEECIENNVFQVVSFEEDSENENEETDGDIVVKVILKKSDLKTLKNFGFRVECS